MAVELPSGTVTFLFSDIEGSTRLLQQLGNRWGDVVTAHNTVMRDAFAATGGREVDRQGDAFFAVFRSARNAIAAAATAQRGLAAGDWPDGVTLRVRMGIHTGEPALGEEGYLGLDVVRAARICALARGGQVLVSESTRTLARGELDGLELHDLGEHRLKDIHEPERLYQLVGAGLDAAPAVTAPAAEPEAVDLAVAGREMELATEAMARLRELELGPLARLGPQIERQVQEALRNVPSSEQARIGGELHRGLDKLEQLPVSPGRVLAVGTGLAVLFGLGILALLVWLLVWLLTALL